MLIPALVFTALAIAAVLLLLRQSNVDPAEFDRRAQRAEPKPPVPPVTKRARPPAAPRNRETRQNVRPTTRPDRPAGDEAE